MAPSVEPADPWDTQGLPFTRVWPVYGGVAVGLVVAVIWLAIDRPISGVTTVFLAAGAVAGALAAALAPTGQRRGARFLDVAYPALVAGVSARFFGAVGALLTTDDPTEDTWSTAFVFFLVLMFFVGFPVLIAKVFQNPNRRLPEDVLAKIGEPYPTRREPRLVTIRAEDGSTHRISVVRGGYVAGLRVPFEVAAVAGVVHDDKAPTGPRGRRPTSRSGSGTKGAPSAKAPRARAKDKGANGAADGDDPTSDRTPPPATSRTTPKGTQGKPKRPKR